MIDLDKMKKDGEVWKIQYCGPEPLRIVLSQDVHQDDAWFKATLIEGRPHYAKKGSNLDVSFTKEPVEISFRQSIVKWITNAEIY